MIKFLLALMETLEGQGLSPNAVLIEDAANDPTICQLLRHQSAAAGVGYIGMKPPLRGGQFGNIK